MKNKLFLVGFLSLFVFACKKEKTEQTLTLQPGPSDGNSMFVTQNSGDPNWATGNVFKNQNVNQELSIGAVVINGTQTVLSRAFISFDLSSIPKDAEIVSAKLSLFGLSSPKSVVQGNYGNNSMRIQRIINDWSQETVTWNNQPTASEEGQVAVSPTLAQYDFDLVDVNVTTMVKAMKSSTPNKTAGFYLKLESEIPSRSIVYASNRHSNPAKRPKLVIVYK